MQLRGKLHAESPIYQGNARKTLFTRNGDGSQRLISLAGEIAGTAQSLMDAFIGQSRNGRNIGLLNRMWQRLYGQPMPRGLITKATCQLQESSYPSERFFDLRMGIKLDEDRWSVESNANYKMETLLRHSVFDLVLQVSDKVLTQGDNGDKLYYVLQEISAGRFWFGAGKSKGLGRCRLEIDLSYVPSTTPAVHADANHMTVTCSFDATNPLLVGWNWGKIDPNIPAFAAVEGRILLDAMHTIPDPIRERLQMSIGGPILSTEDWLSKLADYLPRVTAIWLRDQSVGESESWTLPAPALTKLGKGKKHALSKKVIASVQPLTDTPFPSREAAETAITHALGQRANMAKRILNVMMHEKTEGHAFNQAAWQEVAVGLNLDPKLGELLATQIEDGPEFASTITQACLAILPQLEQQVERQTRLLRSDSWVDVEIESRKEHLQIKEMLRDGQISGQQWGDYNQTPDGVTSASWREFLSSHNRVRYQHMMNRQNLNKSITNDRNFIEFLEHYRTQARQEMAQPKHTEFRAGGRSGREIDRKHGHPYDTIFMRMLTWKPSSQSESAWEVYIPGGTLKGAFRKRASQVLKTLWGESKRTSNVLDWIFGRQGQIGRVFFSDAYLVDPENADKNWCSMDGIRIDPKTGQPEESAKMAFLYGYGEDLQFRLRLDIQDIGPRNLEAISVLQHLLQDFQRGDIPLGGQKTSGLGWVQAGVDRIDWFTANANGLTSRLFEEQALTQEGLWQTFKLDGEAAQNAFRPKHALGEGQSNSPTQPPRAQAGFISHRSFGGYCGTLLLQAEVLRPIHIQESGEPSFTTTLGSEIVNGWDFFSMAPPEADQRDEERVYALPSRSLKGMIRHIYAIASNANTSSRDLSSLNPVDSLFGWVGSGQDQSIMGRVSFSFGMFEKPEMSWFKVPPVYGEWRYDDEQWKQIESHKAQHLTIADTWRLFPHAPVAPIAQRMAGFSPDSEQYQYIRAILPGAKANVSVRFWNLEKEELQRLIWCLSLEEGLAHKLGKNRYLGFGSLRLTILPESHLIDWNQRYASNSSAQGRHPLDITSWHNPGVIQHCDELRSALHAGGI